MIAAMLLCVAAGLTEPGVPEKQAKPVAPLVEDWPGWRGPRGDGSSREKDLPLKWNATENIHWKTRIPGVGHSSPVVHGDRVFLTTCLLKEQDRVLLCLDRRSGEILWQRVVLTSPLEKRHGLNSHASGTLATDGRHVWTAFVKVRPRKQGDDYPHKPREAGYLPKDQISEMIVSCHTVAGDLGWQKSPGQFYSRHGFCTTPILHKDLVILNGDQDAQAYLVALEQKTGVERWRTDRPERTRSYCAPLLLDAAGKKQLVLSGDVGVISYDPDDGKSIWSVEGPTEQYVASPVFTAGLVFVTAGYPEFHNLAIRPDGKGNVTKTHVAWHEKNVPARKASYVPSPLAFDKWFYVVSDVGWISAFEAKSGRRLFMEELGKHHSASPVLADGRLYCPDDDGVTWVLKAGPKFELLARNALGESCYASPAVSRGQIFIRTLNHLWCIGKKKGSCP